MMVVVVIVVIGKDCDLFIAVLLLLFMFFLVHLDKFLLQLSRTLMELEWMDKC